MSILNQNTTDLQTVIDTINVVNEDIATAITNKGVEVPDGTKLNGMAALINALPQIITSTTEVAEGSASSYPEGTLYVVYEGA